MTGKNNVGCEYSANGKITFQTFDPVKNKFNTTVFVEATEDEVNAAVLLADNAFLELQTISHTLRADFLEEIANEIEYLGDQLVHCYVSESGLSIERALVERTRTTLQLRSFADLVRKNNWVEASIDVGDETRNPPKPDLRKMLIGLGPVVVFGASNFPLAYSTAGGDTASAFAAGCPVIVKSHPMHAGTGELVSSAILKAAKKTNMPNGIFSNLNAQTYEVGKQLVMHSKIKAVGFTGSISGGRALFDLANSRPEPIPVFAEMGSINPVIVLPELVKEKAKRWSEMYANSITNDAGQFCTKPGLIFVIDSPETEMFIIELGNHLLKKEALPMLHPTIFEKFISNKQRAIQTSNGTFVEYASEVNENFGSPSLLIVDAERFRSNAAIQDEVFGPFAVIVKCTNSEELIKCIGILKGQLTGTLLGSPSEFKNNSKLIALLQQKVGRIIFNGVPTGVEVCPSMHHGGPYPASSDSRFTAVGIDAIRRFSRPVVYQNCPDEILPSPLKNINSLKIGRRINGIWTEDNVN